MESDPLSRTYHRSNSSRCIQNSLDRDEEELNIKCEHILRKCRLNEILEESNSESVEVDGVPPFESFFRFSSEELRKKFLSDIKVYIS